MEGGVSSAVAACRAPAHMIMLLFYRI